MWPHSFHDGYILWESGPKELVLTLNHTHKSPKPCTLKARLLHYPAAWVAT